MHSRFRVLAAIFTLVALTLSVGDAVWASMCIPEMAMATASADEVPAAAHCMTDMAAQGVRTGDEGPTRSAPPHCPFAPVSTAGSCVVAASLPAASAVDLVPSPEGALRVTSNARTWDLLLASPFFRPPRA